MKGITPVIAVILLLLITISMVGFAFVWFTRLTQTATESISGQQEQLTDELAKHVRIDNVAGTALALRSTGTKTVQTSELGFFIDGVAKTCTFSAGVTSIAPSTVASCTLATACGAGSRMRVTAPARPDETICK